MNRLSRRALFGGAAAVGGAAFATLDPVAAPAAEAVVPSQGAAPRSVFPSDTQYGDLVRGTNLRHVGRPDYVRLAATTDQVAAALRQAVSAGKRVTVRSGGHCYENFAADPMSQVVIDLSEMSQVYYDELRQAFVVEPGATLGNVYRTLYKGWGVTIPGGSCPSVGAGGHIAGGGYGPLSRAHGLTVDHLFAVEVVVVDRARRVRSVIATRNENDPNRDLWWAHTGGGGGNFGIVTKYFFRTPGITSADPRKLLPSAPREVIVADLSFSWNGLTEAGFTTLLRNFGTWMERNSNPDSPYASLFSQLKPQHRIAGTFNLTTLIDAAVPDADQLLDSFHAAVADGVGVSPWTLERRRLPWLHSVDWPGFTGGGNPNWRFKIKSAYLRRSFTDDQIRAIHHHLTRTDYQHFGALMLITSYGGRANTVAPHATVVPQRDSVLKPQFLAFWTDPAEDAKHLSWVRELYRDVFASTGGVPVPNELADGCYVNYADVDLGDPQWNKSSAAWHDLYYKANYERLRQVKSQWDPLNIFHHAQSIRLP